MTILIHEESQKRLDRHDGFKKNADLDAKINNYVQLNLSKLKFIPSRPGYRPK